MSLARSNMVIQAPRKPHLELPKTKAEFDRLGYIERAQLHEEYPALYEKFTRKENG